MSIPCHEMLPQCEGPKLHPFSDKVVNVEFLRLLSDNEQEGQSHVFEVIINGACYALKMFKFYDVSCTTFSMSEEEINKISIDTIRLQTDPFYNECRAYGRIIECGINGKVAVRCHGYLTLPATIEKELFKRFEVYEWDRDGDEAKLPVSQRQPLRAIVKDLVQINDPLNEQQLNKMRRDLLKMHKLGIYPQDIRERNYGDGLLLDFSIAITTPHWVFETKRSWWIRSMKNEDLNMFQVIILESGVETWLRSVRNREYCMRLRGCRDRKERKRRSRS